MDEHFERQLEAGRQQLAYRRESRDRLDVPRPIEHFAYFPARPERSRLRPLPAPDLCSMRTRLGPARPLRCARRPYSDIRWSDGGPPRMRDDRQGRAVMRKLETGLHDSGAGCDCEVLANVDPDEQF